MRTIILGLGWPVLIAGSIVLIIKGRGVYQLMKGSLVGRVTKALVITMLVEMYSLGAVCTFYMFTDVEIAIWVVLPIFTLWFIVFVYSIMTLIKAQKETENLTK